MNKNKQKFSHAYLSAPKQGFKLTSQSSFLCCFHWKLRLCPVCSVGAFSKGRGGVGGESSWGSELALGAVPYEPLERSGQCSLSRPWQVLVTQARPRQCHLSSFGLMCLVHEESLKGLVTLGEVVQAAVWESRVWTSVYHSEMFTQIDRHFVLTPPFPTVAWQFPLSFKTICQESVSLPPCLWGIGLTSGRKAGISFFKGYHLHQSQKLLTTKGIEVSQAYNIWNCQTTIT